MEKSENTKEVKAKKREKQTKQNKKYFLMEKMSSPLWQVLFTEVTAT